MTTKIGPSPLAEAGGLVIECTDDLAEGNGLHAAALVRSLADSDDGIVLCTHGDVSAMYSPS